MLADGNELLMQMSLNPWFNTLEAPDRLALLSGSESLSLHTGEFVFRQGDGPGGKEAILSVLDAGDWFANTGVRCHVR